MKLTILTALALALGSTQVEAQDTCGWKEVLAKYEQRYQCDIEGVTDDGIGYGTCVYGLLFEIDAEGDGLWRIWLQEIGTDILSEWHLEHCNCAIEPIQCATEHLNTPADAPTLRRPTTREMFYR